MPFDSPINQTGLLFYNTLFDENACCHLALGMGFADTIRDFQNKTLDECRKLGVNDSMIHEDFMIGSADLSIMKSSWIMESFTPSLRHSCLVLEVPDGVRKAMPSARWQRVSSNSVL